MNTNENFSYTVEENLNRRRYEAIGTIDGNYYKNEYRDDYWKTGGGVYSTDGYIELITEDGYWLIKEQIMPGRDLSNPESRAVIKQISQEQYVTNLNSDLEYFPGARTYSIFLNPERSKPESGIYGKNPQITKIARYRDLAIWDLKLLIDGEVVKTQEISSLYSDWFELPEIRVSASEVGDVELQEKQFSKVANTQAVKVSIPQNAPHQKNLYLIDLDSDGREINRTLLFTISNNFNEDAPYHNLICGLSISQCPENTCEVTCGDTICCYNSEGIAVESFPAN